VVPPATGEFELEPDQGLIEAVLDIVRRHPMRQDELERALCQRVSSNRVEAVLDQLEASGRARVIERLGQRFWSAASAAYA
jgi:hypothetical protein